MVALNRKKITVKNKLEFNSDKVKTDNADEFPKDQQRLFLSLNVAVVEFFSRRLHLVRTIRSKFR